jgi:hypothetical protein
MFMIFPLELLIGEKMLDGQILLGDHTHRNGPFGLMGGLKAWNKSHF